MDKMTMGSLFDGSGGFTLGALLSGITPVWVSEIEPFPIRVTTKRLPFIKHLGDINKINGAEIEPVDIITFGSPCTDMSVAGKREGLHGKQSALFYEAIRVIKEMRRATNGRYPRFIVWENVPGAYSSAGGNDFREVLSEIIKIKDETLSVPMPENGKWLPAGEIVGDGFSVAYRTIDAQFWGVAQRRRRCYLVSDFDGGCAGKILFESEGLSGYTPQGFGAGQGTASDAERSTGEPSIGRPLVFEPGAASRLGGHAWEDATGALRADMGDNRLSAAIPINMQVATRHMSPGESTGFGIGNTGAPAFTLQTAHSHAVAVENHPIDRRIKLDGSDNVPLVMNERQYALTIGKDIANCLSATDYKGTQCVFEPSDAPLDEDIHHRNSDEGNTCDAVKPEAKVYGICSVGSNSMLSDNPLSGIYEAETSRTLDGNGGNPANNQGGLAILAIQGNMIGRDDKNGPQGSGVNEDVCFCLNTIDKHAIAYSLDRSCYNQGRNAQFNISVREEQSQTLVAKGPNAVAQPASFYPQMKAESQCFRRDGTANTIVNGTNPGFHNGVVEPGYTVRRLTPQECAMLQGFPPDWCANLETPEPTEADIAWWSEVFETHRKIMGTSGKSKSRNQIIKWLKNPHSDSAEYKMWGNGVALPCVRFVMAGIAWAAESL